MFKQCLKRNVEKIRKIPKLRRKKIPPQKKWDPCLNALSLSLSNLAKGHFPVKTWLKNAKIKET